MASLYDGYGGSVGSVSGHVNTEAYAAVCLRLTFGRVCELLPAYDLVDGFLVWHSLPDVGEVWVVS